jgi:predicted transcriptional regulator
VQDGISDDLAYTTVLTILRTLERKGHVGHRIEGRAHRYLPLVAREDAQGSAIRRITRKLFSDSPELLMVQLLSERGLTEEQLLRLRDLVDERLREEEP